MPEKKGHKGTAIDPRALYRHGGEVYEVVGRPMDDGARFLVNKDSTIKSGLVYVRRVYLFNGRVVRDADIKLMDTDGLRVAEEGELEGQTI